MSITIIFFPILILHYYKYIYIYIYSPGVIRTPIGASMGTPNAWLDPAESDLLSHTIIQQFGEPCDVANMVLYLASDQANYLTGSEYFIDGGFMCL